jgi:hypothetical protein
MLGPRVAHKPLRPLHSIGPIEGLWERLFQTMSIRSMFIIPGPLSDALSL